MEGNQRLRLKAVEYLCFSALNHKGPAQRSYPALPFSKPILFPVQKVAVPQDIFPLFRHLFLLLLQEECYGGAGLPLSILKSMDDVSR